MYGVGEYIVDVSIHFFSPLHHNLIGASITRAHKIKVRHAIPKDRLGIENDRTIASQHSLTASQNSPPPPPCSPSRRGRSAWRGWLAPWSPPSPLWAAPATRDMNICSEEKDQGSKAGQGMMTVNAKATWKATPPWSKWPPWAWEPSSNHQRAWAAAQCPPSLRSSHVGTSEENHPVVKRRK